MLTPIFNRSSKARAVFALPLVLLALILQQVPSLADTTTTTPAATNNPVAADTSLPQIQQLTVSATRDGSSFTLAMGMKVQIHLNAIHSITVKFAPRFNSATNVDPSLCTQPTTLSSIGNGTTQSPPSLQSRSINGLNYLEVHTIVSTTTLALGQDVCPGQYLLTSISLIDIAGHDLTITANQLSTSSTAATSTTLSDTPVEQSSIWQKFPNLAPCPVLSNVPTKSTNQTTPSNTTTTTTTGSTPLSSIYTHSTCDQQINFPVPLFTVQSSGNSSTTGPAVPNPNTIVGQSGNLPVIDYAGQLSSAQTQIQSLKAENSRLTVQIQDLQTQVALLNKNLLIYEEGNTPSAIASPSVPLIDYQALATSLQAQVKQLTAQLAKQGSTSAKSASPKPNSPSATPTPHTSAQTYPHYKNYGGATGAPHYYGFATKSPAPSKSIPSKSAPGWAAPSASPKK